MEDMLNQVEIVERLAVRPLENEAEFIDVDIADLFAYFAMQARAALLTKSFAVRLRRSEALDEDLAIVVREFPGIAQCHHELEVIGGLEGDAFGVGAAD